MPKMNYLQKVKHCQFFGKVLSVSVVFWHVLSYHHASAVLINTTQGVIQGFSQGGASVFLGVPYAQPPIGQLRFKPTVFPAEPWSGILNASEFGNVCYQILRSFMPPDEYPVSEDCLYLNVFTPDISPSAQLPVMVWIHGGGFIEGSSTQHGVDGIIENFCTRGVIVVTINYRLGIFGFFSTEDPKIPGNYGIYDQIAALKWVQKEISRFGGDPNHVTMFGQSVGAGSVSVLTMSPLAKGFYSTAIMESGSAFCPWFNYAYEGNSKDVAMDVGCINEEKWNAKQTKGLLDCMQEFDSQTLFQVATKYYPGNFKSFHPVVDGEGGVMPDVPENLAKNRQNVPLLMGTNHDETNIFYFGVFAVENYTYENFTKEFFETSMRADLLPPLEAYGEKADQVAEKIKKTYGYYTIPPNDNMQWLNATIQMRNGNRFFAGAVKDAEAALNNGNENVFLYSFDYISDGYPYTQGYEGTITDSVTLEVKLPCRTDFRKFPFDSAQCTLTLGPANLANFNVTSVWKSRESAVVPSKYRNLATHKVILVELNETSEQVAPGIFRSVPVCRLHLKRHNVHYILLGYTVNGITLFLAWVAFFFDPARPTRIILLLFTLLLLILQYANVMRNVPKVGYLMNYDMWTIGCITWIFGILIESAYLAHLCRVFAEDKNRLRLRFGKIDRVFIFVFLILLLICCAAYICVIVFV